MALNILSPQEPRISQELRAFDLSRVNEVERRHQLLVEYQRLKGFDALLLQSPEMFRWLTGGAENSRLGLPPFAALLITDEARVVLCSQPDAPQLFDRELNGLGFLVKERPWTEGAQTIRQDCIRGRKIGGDVWFPGTENVAEDLVDFRLTLSEIEVAQVRDLGRTVAHAVEATARNMALGDSEFEVAGQLSHRLLRHGVTPVDTQVHGDGRGHRYRNWSGGGDCIEKSCVLSACGRRNGLHVRVARTVCFGEPVAEIQDTFDVASLLQATAINFSMAGWSVKETWQRVERIYEKFGVPDEWRLAEQGELLGYSPNEERISPQCSRTLSANQVVSWHPSVRSSCVCDTILVQGESPEVLTPHENWPTITVRVRDHAIQRPGLLIREPA